MADDTETPGSKSPAGKDAAHYHTEADPVGTPHENYWPSKAAAYDDGYAHGYYRAMTRKTQRNEDTDMGEGINTDKVIVNAGSGGGEGGAGLLAAIAGMMGRQGEGGLASALPLLLADRSRNDDGYGMNAMWPLLLLLLRGRGGLGGDGDNGEVERPVFNAAVLSKLGSIEGSIPTTALQTQNSLQSALASLALGTAQGFERTGDRIQNATYLLTKELCDVNQNVSSQGCQTREVVQDTGREIMNLINGNRISELEAQIARLHGHDHARESEIRITQTVNQNQQQAQAQAQLQGLFGTLQNLANDLQLVKQGQTIFNSGTMAASGTQAAANTRVN